MGDLFLDYEKDFGALSAEIVAKTNKIPNVHGCMYFFIKSCTINSLTFIINVIRFPFWIHKMSGPIFELV